MRRLIIALGLCIALPAAASDGVASTGKLGTVEFYRLIACGAKPGGDCQGPFVRWSKRIVSVGIPPADPAMDAGLASQIDVALDRAISTLNAARFGLRLQRATAQAVPDIVVHRVGLKEGDRTKDLAGMSDGLEIGVGYMQINWDDNLHITDGAIVIAADIAPEDVRSVMLEELTQSLGFLYDIENPYYEGVSIFSQDSNATIEIAGQDRAILRLHYPSN